MLQQRTKNNNSNEQTKLRLIEINTIAVGLGAAAKLMHTWHKYVEANLSVSQGNFVSLSAFRRVLMRTRPELVSEVNG